MYVRKGYNFDMQVQTVNGIQQLYVNCWPRGDSWQISVNSPQLGRLELPLDAFEEMVLLHLHRQNFTIWTPDEKLAAYAMAHMAGFLGERDELKWNK